MDFKKEIAGLLQAYQKNEQPLVKYRCFKPEAIRDYYVTNSYPERLTKWNLSLLTAYYQEAIYDGIKWHEQYADLRHSGYSLQAPKIRGFSFLSRSHSSINTSFFFFLTQRTLWIAKSRKDNFAILCVFFVHFALQKSFLKF